MKDEKDAEPVMPVNAEMHVMDVRLLEPIGIVVMDVKTFSACDFTPPLGSL